MEKPKILSMKDVPNTSLSDSDVPPLPGRLSVQSPLSADAGSSTNALPTSPSAESAAFRGSESPSASPLSKTISPRDSEREPGVSPSSGSPPWVDSNGPVPSYPGVGRPRVASISQGSSPTVEKTPPASTGKLYERPELDADHFAEDLASQTTVSDPTPSGVSSPLSNAPVSTVAQEYRSIASADLRPVAAPSRPRTPEEERAHAKLLAAQIHQDNQKAGLLGQIKRMFGLR